MADSVAIRREAYPFPRGKPFWQVIGYKLKITVKISATPTRTAGQRDRQSFVRYLHDPEMIEGTAKIMNEAIKQRAQGNIPGNQKYNPHH